MQILLEKSLQQNMTDQHRNWYYRYVGTFLWLFLVMLSSICCDWFVEGIWKSMEVQASKTIEYCKQNLTVEAQIKML